MVDKIEFSTQYTKTKLSELKLLTDEKAKIELVLRSLNEMIPSVKRDEAITICEQELSINPQHDFFNFARALLEKDKKKKMELLAIAANSMGPCGVQAQAAYHLAEIYCGKEYVKAQAWITKAILLR